jgi:hypothetical protein
VPVYLRVWFTGIAVGWLATPLLAGGIDTLRVGSPLLSGARLRDTTYLMESFKRTDGVDMLASTTQQTVRRGRQGDLDTYIIETLHVPVDGDTTRSSTVVRASDFALLHHKVKAHRDSTAATVNGMHLTGWVALPNQPVRLLDVALEAPVFPVEGQMPWLFPVAPLDSDYQVVIPHFSEWAGGIKWETFHVLGSEVLEFRGAQIECWKVDAGLLFPEYRATRWVDKKTRSLIKSVARGPKGKPEYWSRAQSPE